MVIVGNQSVLSKNVFLSFSSLCKFFYSTRDVEIFLCHPKMWSKHSFSMPNAKKPRKSHRLLHTQTHKHTRTHTHTHTQSHTISLSLSPSVQFIETDKLNSCSNFEAESFLREDLFWNLSFLRKIRLNRRKMFNLG